MSIRKPFLATILAGLLLAAALLLLPQTAMAADDSFTFNGNGSHGYPNIQAAIDSVLPDGSATIVLTDTINYSGGLILNNNKTINLNVGNHILSITNNAGIGLELDNARLNLTTGIGSFIVKGTTYGVSATGGSVATVSRAEGTDTTTGVGAFASGNNSMVTVNDMAEGILYGAHAENGGQVQAGSAWGKDQPGAIGAYADGADAKVTVNGLAKGKLYGAVAISGGQVQAGSAEGTHHAEATGAYAVGAGAKVTVTDWAKGVDCGAYAQGGGQVQAASAEGGKYGAYAVSGGQVQADSAKGTLHGFATGAYADGADAKVTVTRAAQGLCYGAFAQSSGVVTVGSAEATAANGTGAYATGGGKVTVTGDVTVTDPTGIGAHAEVGGEVNINGTLTVATAALYVKLESATPMEKGDGTANTGGYLEVFEDSVNNNIVRIGRIAVPSSGGGFSAPKAPAAPKSAFPIGSQVVGKRITVYKYEALKTTLFRLNKGEAFNVLGLANGGRALLIEKDGREGYVALKDIGFTLETPIKATALKKAAAYTKLTSGKLKRIGYYDKNQVLHIYGISGKYLINKQANATYYLDAGQWKLSLAQ